MLLTLGKPTSQSVQSAESVFNSCNLLMQLDEVIDLPFKSGTNPSIGANRRDPDRDHMHTMTHKTKKELEMMSRSHATFEQ